MTIALCQTRVEDLSEVIEVLGQWQHERAPMQIHPGDLGWLWRFGADATAAAVRTWRREGDLVAIGFLDGPTLLRVTPAPGAYQDQDLASRITADLISPAREVLPDGRVYVEAPTDALLQQHLQAEGWATDEPWTPLRRDLRAPVEDPGLRIEVVGATWVSDRVVVQRAAFANSTFTEDRWWAMKSGVAYSNARCLLGLDPRDVPVAAITVWSAGPGRPGLVEPMGVHHGHRGHGYGRAITLAGAAMLRQLGSSSALVCTRSSNTAGLATYVAAGFLPGPEVRDRRRDG